MNTEAKKTYGSERDLADALRISAGIAPDPDDEEIRANVLELLGRSPLAPQRRISTDHRQSRCVSNLAPRPLMPSKLPAP